MYLLELEGWGGDGWGGDGCGREGGGWDWEWSDSSGILFNKLILFCVM